LRLFAAGSLRPAFDALAAEWRESSSIAVALTYSNAPDLARRIESGEPADVFASASAGDPARLHAMGLTHRPAPLAANRLVVHEEQTVDAIARRLYDGEADAAVLYATDAYASDRRLRGTRGPFVRQPTSRLLHRPRSRQRSRGA
jgi:molybdate transport system substrate-binding protein